MNDSLKNKILNTMMWLCLIGLFFTIMYGIYDMEYNKVKEPFVPQTEMKEDITDIPVNPPVPLSYKTKNEIYDLRKQYVKSSIFANDLYVPSEYVFGQIQDNKPWISTYRCHQEGKPSHIDGDSEESRFINNPSILVGLDFPYGFVEEKDLPRCSSLLLAKKVQYDKNKNEIIVEYPSQMVASTGNSSYMLKGLNAVDFGYKYAYIDKKQSKNIVRFIERNNITNRVVEFYDFIHLGGSCGVEGGCNNGSPRQPMVEFKYFPNEGEHVLYIKLWKDKPLTPSQPADISEKIIIRAN